MRKHEKGLVTFQRCFAPGNDAVLTCWEGAGIQGALMVMMVMMMVMIIMMAQ